MAIRRRWLVLAVAVTTVVLVAFDRLMPVYWVGHADLEVEFVVVDDKGNPVEEANIDIESEGGFYDDTGEKPSFTLRTDSEGKTRHVCRRSMCFGTETLLGITDSRGIHQPCWRFRVSAAGHETTPERWMSYQPVQWSGNKAMMTVQVELRAIGDP